MMAFKKTNIIYNDLEIFKHKDIYKSINIMQCSSIKNTIRMFHDTKTTLYYEVSVKLKDELDPREYKYDTLNEALTATYFLYLLVQKEGYKNIQDYKIFTTVKDGENRVIIEDSTDNFHYWKTIIEKTQSDVIKKLKAENELYKKFCQQPEIKRHLKYLQKNCKDEEWFDVYEALLRMSQ